METNTYSFVKPVLEGFEILLMFTDEDLSLPRCLLPLPLQLFICF